MFDQNLGGFRLSTKANEKVQHYRTIAKAALHPLLLSLGGTLEARTSAIFAHWASVSEPAVWSGLELSIGLSLLRARAQFYLL
jgi:hypothetical protein